MKFVYTYLLLFISIGLFAQMKPIQQRGNHPPVDGKNIQLEKNLKKTPSQSPTLDYRFSSEFKPTAFDNAFEVKAWNEGRPIFIKGRLKTESLTPDSEDQGAKYLESIAPLLGVENASEEFVLSQKSTDDLGMEHLRYRQYYKDIPIWSSEWILHATNGIIDKSNGKSFSTPKLDLDINILTEEQIKDRIRESNPEKQLTPAQSRFIKYRWSIEKVIYPIGSSDEMRLCYHVEYFPTAMTRVFYIVDAQSGEFLNEYEGVCKMHNHSLPESTELQMPPPDGPAVANATDLSGTTRTINTYESNNVFYMMDASRPMFNMSSSGIFESDGLIVTLDAQNTSPENSDFDFIDISSNNNTWSDQISVSAHYNAGESYEYFRDIHSRNSINGIGGNMISLVHVADPNGNAFDNAFWNGQAIWYGDGAQAFFPLAGGLDVAGHEMSHGVVQSSANLVYQGESGALNESFSDVFGAMIDFDSEWWLIGDDIVKPQFFPSGAMRDLKDPHNGASVGDYQGGFQPKHTNEMFTGSADNGGVHINSGIPNHAFYLFAEAVGADKAQRVWYRALTNYLTMSSQFIDFRLAVIQSAQDICNTSDVQALADALDQVGIFDGEAGNYQSDVGANTGEDFLVMTDINSQQVFLANLTSGEVQQISNKNPISKPSITDDGAVIVFIGDDLMMHAIELDWNGNVWPDVNESILQSDPIWRNIVISRDGNRLAGLFDDLDNRIWVYDFTVGAPNEYELFNPTTSTGGNTTGDVEYADALEFDFSGEWVMYDALNRVNGSGSTQIEYWDIGFLNIWNDDFWSLGEVSKLFSNLPDDVSVGNPTFSKNSPYIIAFDYFQGSEAAVLGYNIETGEDGLIREQPGLGYPSFSRLDNQMVYDDRENGSAEGIGLSDISDTKISGGNHTNLSDAFRWASWFGNGDRTTSLDELSTVLDGLSVFPNPSSQQLNIQFESANKGKVYFELVNLLGRSVYGDSRTMVAGENLIQLNLASEIPTGSYILKIKTAEKEGSTIVQILN